MSRRSSYFQTREGRDKRTLDGIIFGSELEKTRYIFLRALYRTGEIRELQCHPKFVFVVEGVNVGEYTPDFSYIDKKDKLHVEDVKGFQYTRTGKLKARYNREFPLQKNLMLALFGIEVEVV